MTALTADRNTPMQDADIIAIPIAANTICYAGGMACVNALGFAVPATTALNLTYLGRFEQTVNNTGGANGVVSVNIRRNKAFKFINLATDLVPQASLGKLCYMVDDTTVAGTNGVSTRSPAGIVVGIDVDGVWVK